MSIIRAGLSFISGCIVQIALVKGVSSFFHWNLSRFLHNRLVWALLGIGFLSACLFHLWFALINRIFRDNSKPIKIGQPTHPMGTSGVLPANVAPAVQSAGAVTSSPTVENTNVTTTSVVSSVDSAVPVATPATTPVAATVLASPSQVSSAQNVRTAPVPPRPMALKVAPPARMAVQNKAVLNINPTQPTPTAPTSVPSTPSVGVHSTPVQSNLKNDIAMLYDLDSELDMQAFKYIVLDSKKANERIDLVYSSDEVAVLCKVLSDPHTWSVDTTQSIENCVWTDEQGGKIQPCALLLKQAADLKQMEPAAEVIPTFVVMRGQIQNYPQVADYLLQNKITLLQYENEKMSDLTSLHDLLRQKFSLYPETEDTMDETDEADEANLSTDSQESADTMP